MNSQFGSPAAVAAARKLDNEVPEFKMDGATVRRTTVTQAATKSASAFQDDLKLKNMRPYLRAPGVSQDQEK